MIPHVRILLPVVFAVLLVACSEESETEPSGLPDAPIDPAASSDPGTWNLANVPDLGEPLRKFVTPSGAHVHVMTPGKGEPIGKGRAMNIRYAAYFVTGLRVDRAAVANFVPGGSRWIKGLSEGMEGARLRELRRLLIPAELNRGNLRRDKNSPGGNMIIDVEWVQLEREDIRVGVGDVAKVGDKITVHYLGKLADGTVFDSSYKRDAPFTSTLKKGGLIDGWVLGIPGMKVGGTRKLWIPWHLAYREQDKGNIPPYSDLTFVVELIAVE